jgi:hypothetical protein
VLGCQRGNFEDVLFVLYLLIYHSDVQVNHFKKNKKIFENHSIYEKFPRLLSLDDGNETFESNNLLNKGKKAKMLIICSSALSNAIKYNHISIFQLFYDLYQVPDIVDWSSIHSAYLSGHYHLVKSILMNSNWPHGGNIEFFKKKLLFFEEVLNSQVKFLKQQSEEDLNHDNNNTKVEYKSESLEITTSYLNSNCHSQYLFWEDLFSNDYIDLKIVFTIAFQSGEEETIKKIMVLIEKEKEEINTTFGKIENNHFVVDLIWTIVSISISCNRLVVLKHFLSYAELRLKKTEGI